MFCTLWLRNVLRATTACTFSTSQLPKVVRHWCVLYVLTSKCASRHSSVHFSCLIWPAGSAPAALASLLFDPPEPQIIGNTERFATFLPFRASASSFFWLFLFYHLLSSAPLLPASAQLCFSSVHIVGSLTSKLPSNISKRNKAPKGSSSKKLLKKPQVKLKSPSSTLWMCGICPVLRSASSFFQGLGIGACFFPFLFLRSCCRVLTCPRMSSHFLKYILTCSHMSLCVLACHVSRCVATRIVARRRSKNNPVATAQLRDRITAWQQAACHIYKSD